MAAFNPGMKPEPMMISRLFEAPRETVFRAWSSAANIRQWFSPLDCSVPEAEVDFRAGGVFAVCMLLPDGSKNWSRGQFIEVTPPERLSFGGQVDANGKLLFKVLTTVTFAAEGTATRLTVRQDYELFDEAMLGAVGGATEGWRTTLDKLENLVARLATPAVHDSFTLERVFAASPARVYKAFTDIEAKNKWFAGGEGYQYRERSMDARPGGREVAEGEFGNGTISRFDAIYFELVPDTRLVYAYEMHLNGARISVSLATVQLFPEAGGTRLKITEQGVFVNGYEDKGSREQGTEFLLGQLGTSLGEPPAVRSPAPHSEPG